eukprot:766466-Hanusia_phi.AAC.2
MLQPALASKVSSSPPSSSPFLTLLFHVPSPCTLYFLPPLTLFPSLACPLFLTIKFRVLSNPKSARNVPISAAAGSVAPSIFLTRVTALDPLSCSQSQQPQQPPGCCHLDRNNRTRRHGFDQFVVETPLEEEDVRREEREGERQEGGSNQESSGGVQGKRGEKRGNEERRGGKARREGKE